MELIENGDSIDIIITVDINKLKMYGSMQYSTAYGTNLHSNDPELVKFKENIGLKRRDKKKFKERFDQLLMGQESAQGRKRVRIDFKQQQSDLIFILDYLKKSAQQYVFKRDKDLVQGDEYFYFQA